MSLLQRAGDVLIQRLPNVQQVTIQPVLTQTNQPGCLLYIDEYDIYSRLEARGCQHKTVNHSAGEYAHDEDSNGFHEVHVNTTEGLWTDVHNFLRPFKGVHKLQVSGYVAMAEFRRNHKCISPELIALLVTPHTFAR